ncbi:hypothetical protein [Microcystis panniformis]|uniref:hypothetical protein n=1 Tax=Microcystis panniformis TaxID=513223 RepID=UPI00069255C9|nr:hypothetical protein [Microcystis panniformis]
MTTNTEPQLKKDLEEALEASPETDKKIKISLSEEEGIDVICEVKPDKLPDKGKTVVAYTAYQEGKDGSSVCVMQWTGVIRDGTLI